MNTSWLHLRTPNVYRSTASPATPWGSAPGTGWKGTFVIGATFVYFHASALVVGKPSSRKRLIAASRVRWSQRGAPPSKSFWRLSNAWAYRSVGLMATATAAPPSGGGGLRDARLRLDP